MLIIAGHFDVSAEARDDYVAACHDMIRRGRAAPGCHRFVIAADPVEPGRIHMFEAWEDDTSLAQWRSVSDPPVDVAPSLSADVHRYDVARIREPFESQ